MLTKLIGALVGVMLLAGNAWAFNEEHPEWEWTKARDICVKAGGEYFLCAMKHMPERDAVFVAGALLDECGNTAVRVRFGDSERFTPQYEKLCTETRAYIKQRWGY